MLAEVTRQATEAGAKVLLVGDHRQLSAVDAGGAFGLLATETGAVELTSLWRFRHPWEVARRPDSYVSATPPPSTPTPRTTGCTKGRPK